MPIDPSIISNSFANMSQNMPDVNALMQQRVQGAENIYKIEAARQEQASEAEKEAAQQAAEAMLPAVASAFYDPSDAGLDVATTQLPPEVATAFTPFMQRLKAIPDVKQRLALLRAELAKDDEGRYILGQLEPTANMRLQEATAGRRAALDERRLALEEARLAAEAEGGGVSPDVAARLEFDREKFAVEREKEARIASGEAAPVQLQKGERWNPEKQRVEAVPGSQTYNKQKSVQAKDYGAAKNALRELEKVKGVVSDLKNTTGYQKAMNTGVVMANTPNIPVVSNFSGAYDFQTKYKNLKGSVATLGRAAASLQGKLGNMAVQEWKLVSDAIANLDLDTMNANVLDDQLDVIANDILRLEAQVQDAYENEWGDTQFYAPLEGAGASEQNAPADKKNDPLGIR
jgi:hypothetical protein